MELDPKWEFVSDQVMGGVSRGDVQRVRIDGRCATRLTGHVSLDNNGGFVQMAFDLAKDGGPRDLSAWDGIALEIMGNGEDYEIRLRTSQLTRPWQSYRSGFGAAPRWRTLRFPFREFEPHRIDLPFDATQVRRVGLLGIGRVFEVDIAVSAVTLYR